MISDLNGLDNFISPLDKEEHFFAQNLYNFLCALKQNKELWRVINEKALAEENEDCSALNAKQAQLLKTLKSEYEKVEQCCEEHSIEMPAGFMGVEGISEFRAYEQGKIVSSLHIIDSLIQSHINALSNLVNTDLEFVKQFALVNEEGCIVSLTISPLIDEWNVKKQALARKQTSKFWYAVKQLTRFHNTYHDFEHLRIDALKSGKLFEEWLLCDDLKKNNDLNNSKGYLYKKELRFYVQQVSHRLPQILQELSIQQDKPQLAQKTLEIVKQEIVITELEKKLHLSFPNDESICFDQYEMQDMQEGEILRFKLLRTLINNHSKTLSKKNLRESLNAEDEEINRARRGINERAPMKYKDFITRSYQGSMAFNNKYHIVFKKEGAKE